MEDLTGRTIGGYQIVEQIGRGGMATVFRAYQPSLERDVAFKVLPPYYAEQDESFLQRFKREARAIAKLRHPNILMVLDFGEEGDLAYLVMEYVNAGTLKERLDNRSISLSEIYNLVSQVASALDYAHEQGVVHRDIKPSNIMLPRPDWALLTDFGLAKMVGGSFLTQSGLTVGTPAYMSPEQGSGKPVDRRSDIYSLGVMLYEMVVGEVPYTAETPMAVVVKHIVDPLPMPRAKNPDIPEVLQRVILKALAKNPDDRFDHAGEIAAALEKIAHSFPDWSAAEMKTVTSLRSPYEDKPETKMMTDETDSGETIQDEIEAPFAEQAEAEPASPMPPPFSPDTLTPKPAPKKKSRIPLILGGIGLVAICLFVIALGLRAIRNQIGVNDSQPTDTPAALVEQSGTPEQAPDVQIQIAIDLLDQGEFERAREAFRIALKRNPQMWEPFIKAVHRQYDEGKWDMAVKLLQTGIEANPEAPIEDHSWLGWIYIDLGMPKEAIKVFEAVIQRDLKFEDAYNGLCTAARDADRVNEEIGFLGSLAQQFPNQPLIQRSLGDMFALNGDYNAAVMHFTRAQELAPNDPWVFMLAAPVYLDMGDRQQAEFMIEQALKIAPNHPDVLSQAGWIYLNDLENYERAAQTLEKAYQMNPENGWAALGWANALAALSKDMQKVPELLQNAERIGMQISDIWLLNDIAWAYYELDDCENAARIFNYVEGLAPGATDAADGLSACAGED